MHPTLILGIRLFLRKVLEVHTSPTFFSSHIKEDYAILAKGISVAYFHKRGIRVCLKRRKQIFILFLFFFGVNGVGKINSNHVTVPKRLKI